MLVEAEDGLIALVKNSPLGRSLAKVDSLPDLEGDSLVERFASDAPAVYVVMASFPIAEGSATLKGGIACVARNSRGHAAARKGDGKAIGLYQIVEGVVALVEGKRLGDAAWRVTGVDFMADEKLYKAGLYVGVIRIETAAAVPLPPALNEAALDSFNTLHADYDIPPHVSGAEHAKWLQEPPNHGASAPELTDQQTLQP